MIAGEKSVKTFFVNKLQTRIQELEKQRNLPVTPKSEMTDNLERLMRSITFLAERKA